MAATRCRDDLLVEVRPLRVGIRGHRDSSGHHLCRQHPQLWAYRNALGTELVDAPRSTREYDGGSPR